MTPEWVLNRRPEVSREAYPIARMRPKAVLQTMFLDGDDVEASEQ